MSQMQGSSALGRLGIVDHPVGTLAELQKEGLDPYRVACCHKEVKGSIKGCGEYERCAQVFALTKHGGFRENGGPHNIGYYHRTHEGVEFERSCSCFYFMRHLRNRQMDGERDRQNGLNGELIEIIEQEGGRIRIRESVNANADKPNLPASYKPETKTVEVPKFPRPSDRGDLSYETELRERRRVRLAGDRSLDTGPPPRVSDDYDDPMEKATPAAADLDAAAAAVPVATPTATARPLTEKEAKKGPGG
jgi:hypothetical protein